MNSAFAPLQDYRERQILLMQQLPANSLVIIPAATTQYMSANIPYRFRQNSDFNYLCGYPEKDAVLLLESNAEKKVVSSLGVSQPSYLPSPVLNLLPAFLRH